MAITRSGDWLSTSVDGEIVMMHMTSGDYVGLTSTGSIIWDALEESADIETICAALCDRFDVSEEQCRGQVEEFLQKMSDRGAIEGYSPTKA